MEYQIGKQIRDNRLKCNLTQEKLAELLNVSAQAVSKWETAAGYPDISLLPELSAALGVTVDALFETGTETHLRRIERMLENANALSREDFDYAERFLKDGCLDLDLRGRCLTLLGELYNHRARMYRSLAENVAKQALEFEPEKHDNHCILCEAMDGVFMDWNTVNHNELIAYYQSYVKKNPRDRAGYLWLMDNLIVDGRYAEAKEALEAMRAVKETYHYPLYQGWIARYELGWEAAEPYWNEMLAKYPDDWHTWFCRADAYAKRTQYQQAIEHFRRANEIQPAPRFIDSMEAVAQICPLLGDKKGAIEAYEEVIRISREDWDFQEGATIQSYQDKIEKLRK